MALGIVNKNNSGGGSGIDSAYVDPAGNLIIVTPDNEINAGHVKGDQGDPGDDGARWFTYPISISGATAFISVSNLSPSDVAPSVGDFVLSSSGYIYIVEIATPGAPAITVNRAFSIKGDKGDKGDQGDPGANKEKIIFGIPSGQSASFNIDVFNVEIRRISSNTGAMDITTISPCDLMCRKLINNASTLLGFENHQSVLNVSGLTFDNRTYIALDVYHIETGVFYQVAIFLASDENAGCKMIIEKI